MCFLLQISTINRMTSAFAKECWPFVSTFRLFISPYRLFFKFGFYLRETGQTCGTRASFLRSTGFQNPVNAILSPGSLQSLLAVLWNIAHWISTFWRQMPFWLPEKTMKLRYTLMFYVLYTLSDLIHIQITKFSLKVLSLILDLESFKKVAEIESLRQSFNVQSGPP